MTGLEIAALVSMIAGAGMQYKAASDAQRRQQEEIRAGLASQRELQMQAEQKALGAAEKFATPDRQADQKQIEDTITEELIAPVSESQTIRAGQQTTQGDVSGDYKAAKATSDINALKAAEGLARMMGKTSSANRLRMNEGIRLADTGMDIDRLASFSRGQAGADQIATQQAGQMDPGLVFSGSILQGLGSAGMMMGGGSAGTAAGDGLKATTGNGTSLFNPTGGLGLKMSGGSGLGIKATSPGLKLLGI